MSLFEIAYWAAILTEIAIRAPINRQRRRGKISARRDSTQEKVLFGLLSLGMFFLPLFYSATNWLGFANYALPTWAGWAGVVIIAGAVFVFWRAHADLGLNWSPTLEIREKHELITRGIYGVIRHPMYASQWLWVIAQPLLLQNWIAGLFDLVFFIPFYFLRVRAEEKMMADTFGEQYLNYLGKTGSVFPRVSRK